MNVDVHNIDNLPLCLYTCVYGPMLMHSDIPISEHKFRCFSLPRRNHIYFLSYCCHPAYILLFFSFFLSAAIYCFHFDDILIYCASNCKYYFLFAPANGKKLQTKQFFLLLRAQMFDPELIQLLYMKFLRSISNDASITAIVVLIDCTTFHFGRKCMISQHKIHGNMTINVLWLRISLHCSL